MNGSGVLEIEDRLSLVICGTLFMMRESWLVKCAAVSVEGTADC